MSILEEDTSTSMNDARKISHDLLLDTLYEQMPNEGVQETAIPDLIISRSNSPHSANSCVCPSISVVLQGRKESRLGENCFQYGVLDCLVNGVFMPGVSRVLEASPEKPMFMLTLRIDPELASELARDIPPSTLTQPTAPQLGSSVAPISPDVLDTFVRLMALLDQDSSMQLMAPLLKRELMARILVGPQGESLRMLYQQGSHSHQIAEAVAWLRDNYNQAIGIEELARHVGMATSTFHREFKRVTSISPLQYQKRLRLYESQRLMLTQNMDANTAAYTVGYESAQQFSREYKRLFGEPPHRNITRLRQNG